MFRPGWFGRNIWKPKNVHSLEHLKYLYTVLSKNQNISESNRSLLVETLRSIAEILIWGDQNDSSVFDFFLEKNMLSFFLKILKQKCGSYVCVQLLQTLNILFENIRNETSLYYLLSNNHVNSIIVHKFDFSDEEVMAYYISFLKTLSLKLNCHTVHFFYNEYTNDFPLYTEAIKFFNHSESMVRIAVRTLTLNVYKVDDKSMLRFIRDRTAAPYFSNLVWFIGNHVLELNTCIHNDINQLSGQNRLSDLVAEHLDHLHYLNDILCLNIDDLNIVLIEHLLNKLLIPLYVMSLLPAKNVTSIQEKQAHVCTPLSLFLLSQVFLIIKEHQLINVLANIVFRGSPETIMTDESTADIGKILSMCSKNWNMDSNYIDSQDSFQDSNEDTVEDGSIRSINKTDEEKEQQLAQELTVRTGSFLEAILSNLKVRDNDYSILLALCILHAISSNAVVEKSLSDSFFSPTGADGKRSYNADLIERLIEIISSSCQTSCRIRLVTLELTTTLLKKLVMVNNRSILLDEHFAAVIGAREESTSLLRNFYKNEDIFLDMFEDEYYDMRKKPLNMEWLMMDSSLLLQPTNTPMTGVEFSKRLPCGEVERIRRAIRVFLLVRDLVLTLSEEVEPQLPLTDRDTCINVGTSLDLNDSDLITCTVLSKDGSKTRRFLAMDNKQLILVEPHSRLLGWGVTKLAGFLQDVEVTGDKEESKCLHVTIHHTNTGSAYSAKFLFDDHIRCMAAKQKLVKGRSKARKKKMAQIANLLDIPGSNISSNFQRYDLVTSRHQNVSSVLYGSCYKQPHSASKTMSGIMSSFKSHYAFNDSNDSTKSTPGTSCESSPKFRGSTSASSREEIQLTHLSKVNENADLTENSQLEETTEMFEETSTRDLENESSDVTSSPGQVKTV